MIKLESLGFAYGTASPLFRNFFLRVPKGARWALLGPSGCGKTTLLYLLAGLLRPRAGSLKIGQENLNGPRPGTGLILQHYGLLPWATIRENILLGLKIRAFYGPDGKHAPTGPVLSAPEQQSACDYWLEHLGLQEVAGKYPARVSGGQRQRAAIARTLILGPDLLLMDEPFASLDAVIRRSLGCTLLQLEEEVKLTRLLVTHSIEEALELSEIILVLQRPPHTNIISLSNPAGPGTPSANKQGLKQELTAKLHKLLEEKDESS